VSPTIWTVTANAPLRGRPALTAASPAAHIAADLAVTAFRREQLAALDAQLRLRHDTPARVVGVTPVGVVEHVPQNLRGLPRRFGSNGAPQPSQVRIFISFASITKLLRG